MPIESTTAVTSTQKCSSPSLPPLRHPHHLPPSTAKVVEPHPDLCSRRLHTRPLALDTPEHELASMMGASRNAHGDSALRGFSFSSNPSLQCSRSRQALHRLPTQGSRHRTRHISNRAGRSMKGFRTLHGSSKAGS